MICAAHPKYGGKYKPRTDCAACWVTFRDFHSEKIVPTYLVVKYHCNDCGFRGTEAIVCPCCGEDRLVAPR